MVPGLETEPSLFIVLLFRLQGQTGCFGCFPSIALLTDFTLIPRCHSDQLEAGGGGGPSESPSDCLRRCSRRQINLMLLCKCDRPL